MSRILFVGGLWDQQFRHVNRPFPYTFIAPVPAPNHTWEFEPCDPSGPLLHVDVYGLGQLVAGGHAYRYVRTDIR